MQKTLTCLQCGTPIDIDQAYAKEIKEKLNQEYQQFKIKKEKEFQTQQKQAIDILEQQKKELQTQEKEFKEKEQTLKAQYEKNFEKEKEQLKTQLKDQLSKEIEQKQTQQLKELETINNEKQKQIEQMQAEEINLRKKTRELDDEKRRFQLDMERKIDQEKKTLEEKISIEYKKMLEQKQDSLFEDFRIKEKEKDKQLQDMKTSLEAMRKKAEQNSMELQGEVQEEDLKSILTEHFPSDQIQDVPKGIRGADLIHTVIGRNGTKHGVLVWESKNTKHFSTEWIQKLKEDTVAVQGDIPILITRALPEGVKYFSRIEGVWICKYEFASSLASSLRLNLEQLHGAKKASTGKGEKMEILYGYLTSNQFKNRIENMVHAYMEMKESLEREKRAFMKIWQQREKQIERMTLNTGAIYGDLQGITGNGIGRIDALELESGLDEQPLLFGEE